MLLANSKRLGLAGLLLLGDGAAALAKPSADQDLTVAPFATLRPALEKLLAVPATPLKVERQLASPAGGGYRKDAEVVITDLDGDGKREGLMMLYQDSRSCARDHDLYGFSRGAAGLKLRKLATFPCWTSGFGSLVAHGGLLAFWGGETVHGVSRTLLAVVHVSAGEPVLVLNRSLSLEDEGLSGRAHHTALDVTMVDLDDSPPAELVLLEVKQCEFRAARPKVLAVTGSKLAPMRNGSAALRRRVALLRPAALAGSIEAAEQLLRLDPHEQAVRWALLRALSGRRGDSQRGRASRLTYHGHAYVALGGAAARVRVQQLSRLAAVLKQWPTCSPKLPDDEGAFGSIRFGYIPRGPDVRN